MERVIEVAFYGVHHCTGWATRTKNGHGLRVSSYGGLSTYDYDLLTRLVVAAHDECVRVEIVTSAPRYLTIYLHPRVRPGSAHDPDRPMMGDAHPTIEDAIARIRRIA
jgi:hypothetical protein